MIICKILKVFRDSTGSMIKCRISLLILKARRYTYIFKQTLGRVWKEMGKQSKGRKVIQYRGNSATCWDWMWVGWSKIGFK